MRIISMAIAAALTFSPAGASGDGKEFTACMSKHGFTATVEDGRITLGNGANPFSKEYRAALESCGSLVPGDSPLPVEPKLPELDLFSEEGLGRFSEEGLGRCVGG